MSEQNPAPYQPQNSHLATYLSAVGALTAASVAAALLPVTIIAVAVGVVVCSSTEKGRAWLGRAGTQTKDLCFDLVHFARKDLVKVRDFLDHVFSKDEKAAEQKTTERPAADLPKPSAPVFNAQSPRAAETAPAAPAAQPPRQGLDVTG